MTFKEWTEIYEGPLDREIYACSAYVAALMWAREQVANADNPEEAIQDAIDDTEF